MRTTNMKIFLYRFWQCTWGILQTVADAFKLLCKENITPKGADRFLLRIETTDKDLYEKMHPHASFENRVRCLEDLKTLGYEVGTGCLVGLPNQTIESLANDILFFKEIDADMIGIGPFIPHSQTPLKNEKGTTRSCPSH